MDDTTAAYLRACLGDTSGWLVFALGAQPRVRGGRYGHGDWSERNFRWPAGAEKAVTWALAAGVSGDVYVCPYLLKTNVRSKGNAVTHRLVHADIDGGLDLGAVAELGGFAVGSGTPGHGHVYVRLSYAVTAAQHELLCRGLAAHLGGDHKVSDNDLLRLPGTVNHKPGGGPVELLTAVGGPPVMPPDLGEALSVDIAHAEWDGAVTFCPPPDRGKPVDVEHYPAVREALRQDTGDRSADTMRIVSACFDAGLLLGQARWAVRTRKDLAARLDEFASRRHAVDDIAICWQKLAPGLQPPPERKRASVPPPPDTGPDTECDPPPDLPGPDAPSPLDDALAVFRKWLYLEDPALVIVTAATVVANRAQGDPVWLLPVGPSSCGKTEVLSSLFGLDDVVAASTITEAALLSGTPHRDRTRSATGGLMRQIGEFGILVCKDFASVLSQNTDTAKRAVAALREVYDGRWDRPVGADGARVLHWEGKAGFIAGVTPAYDRFAGIVNTLGDRYLLLRLRPVDREQQMDAALARGGRGRQMRAELAEAMHGLIASADLGRAADPLSEAAAERLKGLANYASRARTAVERDHHTGRVEVLPEPEAPARVLLALRQLDGGMAAIGVDETTRWSVLTRIAVDCAPRIRLPLIRALLEADDDQRTATIAERVGMGTKTAGMYLDDLVLIGLAVRRKKTEADNSPHLWRAADWLRQCWPGC